MKLNRAFSMSISVEAGREQAKPCGLPVCPEAIPDELKGLARWVVWRYVADLDPDTGETEWDKPPANARTGGLASSTNPATWSAFDVVLEVYHRGGWDGVGLVLHRKNGDAPGGLVGVDLDKCRDPERGFLEPWAQDIVDALGSYTEISPSGRGIRIFLRGDLPPTGRKKGKFEVYQTGRYVTVTGQRIEGTPATVEARQAELDAVHHQVFGEPARQDADGPRPDATLSLNDAELIQKASESKSGDKFCRLWEGDTSGYASRSEADAALANYLAFWTGGNFERVVDLFAQSGLARSKWNRPDYQRRTFNLAMKGRGPGDFYDPGRSSHHANANGDGDGRHKSNGYRPCAISPDPSAPEQLQAHLTDLGNALRLVRRNGSDLRFCHPWGKWLRWDGKRWQIDQTAAVMRDAKQTIVALFAEATGEMDEIRNDMEGAPT